MKENKEKYYEGIHGEIMKIVINLSFIMIILFMITTILLVHALHLTINESEIEQRELAKDSSDEAMMSLATDSLLKTVTWASDQIDDEFWILEHDYNVLNEQVVEVLENPSAYEIKELQYPQTVDDGEYHLQLLGSKTCMEDNPEVKEKLGRIANLAPMMREIVRGNDGRTIDCYVALPDGTAIAMDDMPAEKYDENGEQIKYDASTRAWFKGAVETGDIYFSEDVHSFFYDLTEVTWGMPVYVDGELEAVLEGCTSLEVMEQKLAERNLGETGFSVIISQNGHIICTQSTSGILMQDGDNTTDVREVASPSLAEAVQKGIDQETGFAEVELDGEMYYTAYAPIKTVGWTIMMFVSRKELEEPSQKLMDEMGAISAENIKRLDTNIKVSCVLLLIVTSLIVILTAHVISLRTRKALNPIKTMTKRIRNLDESDMDFAMTDEYKTGNEIEVLGEAFSDLTKRIKVYMNEIFEKTAAEERINAEINTASKIQLAMLPKISDELAQRPEFDIFARMVPAKQVGGDLYDFFLIDNNHLAIVLGDVSGKGITAALFMVLSKNTIQNQLMLYGDDLEKAAYEINRLLIRDNEMKLFVTVWLGVLELDTGVLKFVNAGHELAAISRHMGEFELPKDKHSAIFGMVEDLKYKLNETTLEDGDTLYLFTDGIVEAMKEENNMFGKERMLNALNENPGDSVEKLDETVRTRVTEFVEDAEQFDDITTLCIRYHKK